jgi:chorismate mutase-like protein
MNLVDRGILMKKSELEKLRKKIDAVDRKLLKLLHERACCSQRIGKVKRQLKMKIYSPQREQEILSMLVRQVKKPLPRDAVKKIFKVIMSESRKIQRSI